MSHHSLDYVPRLTQIDGRFYVTIEVPPPIIYPTTLDFLQPGTTPPTTPAADMGTPYPTSMATVNPSQAPIPTLLPAQDYSLDQPHTNPEQLIESDLPHNLTSEVFSDCPSTENGLTFTEALFPPFYGSPGWLVASPPVSMPPLDIEPPFPEHETTSPMQTSTPSAMTLPLLPNIEAITWQSAVAMPRDIFDEPITTERSSAR